MKNIIFSSLLFFLQSFVCLGQTFKVDTLLFNGPSDKYINLVIMGDGYISTEQTKFITDANSITNYLFNESPFKEYKNWFNVLAIRVISPQTGVKHPKSLMDCPTTQPAVTTNNYFGTTFDYPSYHRLVAPTNSTLVYNVLSSNFPDYDQIFILGNSTYYGGAGGAFATSTVSTDAFEVAVHEIGHSFAGLADEYWAGSAYAREKPNMTAQSSPSLVKWKNWIGQSFTSGFSNGTVGVYLAGSATVNWYKPTAGACKMELLGTTGNPKYFCPVCKEAIVEKIHTIANPVVSYTPALGTISSPNQFLSFKLTKLMKPNPNTLKIIWRLNGAIVGRNVDSVKVNQNNLAVGTHTLSVVLEDTTKLLRVDNHASLHSNTLSWTISKIPSNYPSLTTTSTTQITQSSAQSGGTISSDGGFAVISRGVVWSTSSSPTIALATKTSDGSGIGLFTSNVTGLTSGTTYYIRSYATNSQGTSYGDEYTFTTLAIPTVTTTSITSITSTSASSGGTVTSNGGASITSQGVCWSTTANPTNTLTTKTSNGTTSPFTSSITGLSANTTYYVRAYAVNSVGVSYGNQLTFTTTASVPSLTTTAVTSITSNSAVSGGNVTSTGGSAVTARGICYATTQNPTTSNATINSGTGTGTFTSNLTGLAASTTYYVRAFATNSTGTAYGSQRSFTTLSTTSPPTVTTTAISSLTSSTATTGGNVTNIGSSSVTERGVCYSTTPGPTTGSLKLTSGTGLGSYVITITGLSSGTTYYVRAYAINATGTSYGSEVIFTTLNLASLTTTSITSISSNSAASGGSITSDGGAPVTSRGVVWSTTQNPTIDLLTKTSDGNGVGTFSSSLTGLSPSTLYYVRAFATNSVGTSYGSQISFTSSASQQTNSCLVNDLSAYKTNNIWYYRWQINPNCSTYNVRLGRYDSYLNINTPPPAGAVATAYGTRETNLNASTCGCTVGGYINKQMSSAPATLGRWYSVNVTCNATICSGPKETVVFFWVP